MKISRYILGGMAALALLVAIPVHAEMAAITDSDLDGITAKGDASVDFSNGVDAGYDWSDDHSGDISDHKGAVSNTGAVTLNAINTANVWGVYSGAEVFGGVLGGNTEATATSNAGIGGF